MLLMFGILGCRQTQYSMGNVSCFGMTQYHDISRILDSVIISDPLSNETINLAGPKAGK